MSELVRLVNTMKHRLSEEGLILTHIIFPAAAEANVLAQLVAIPGQWVPVKASVARGESRKKGELRASIADVQLVFNKGMSINCGPIFCTSTDRAPSDDGDRVTYVRAS